jgi:hypothetical protein
MNADNSITLKPGFWAKPGSDFRAKTVECGSCRYLNSGTSILKSEFVEDFDKSAINLSTDTKSILTNDSINISPNPSNGYFTITNLANELFTIAVYNDIGVILYSQRDISNTNYELNLSNVPSGIYHLKCSSKSKSFTCKLIKL